MSGVNLELLELRAFVSELLEQPEVHIVGAARAPLGIIVQRMFVNSQKVNDESKCSY